MGDAQGRTWGPKYALTESVNRLTHPVKTPKNAHNTRFFQLARSDRAGRSVALGPEIRGRTALALRLSLRHNPLVNKRADRRRVCWRATCCTAARCGTKGKPIPASKRPLSIDRSGSKRKFSCARARAWTGRAGGLVYQAGFPISELQWYDRAGSVVRALGSRTSVIRLLRLRKRP